LAAVYGFRTGSEQETGNVDLERCQPDLDNAAVIKAA